jgi:hypothetical protein
MFAMLLVISLLRLTHSGKEREGRRSYLQVRRVESDVVLIQASWKIGMTKLSEARLPPTGCDVFERCDERIGRV